MDGWTDGCDGRMDANKKKIVFFVEKLMGM